MPLTPYQQSIVEHCRKVARSRRDPRPGEPLMTYPASAQADIQQIIDAGALRIETKPMSRNPNISIRYLVPTEERTQP
jgi:hypothetical protein